MWFKMAVCLLAVDGILIEIGKRLTQTGGRIEIVIARVRLLEILVESPPRVNAAWLLLIRVPPAGGHSVIPQAPMS